MICTSIALLPLPASSQVADEYAVKAQFLANFALFTEWPASTGPEIVICLYGGDPLGPSTARIDGRKVGGRVLTTRRLHALGEIAQCRMVFVPRQAAASTPAVLAAVRGKPIVTVAESEGAAQQGMMINMLLRNDKVGFEINLEAARQAGIGFSAKLLGLAIAVY